MSNASKVTLALTTASAIGIVYWVHRQQVIEQNAMFEGVVRDVERQRIRDERLREYKRQQKLENEYKKYQRVNPSEK